MDTLAVVMEAPRQLALRQLPLNAAAADDVVVDIDYTGISTGTERLLWTGGMPAFPGMGYPLVPGYESVGRVVDAGRNSAVAAGTAVFVPGASCFGDVRGLFGGAARRLVVPSSRVVPIDGELREHGILMALAATALHAIEGGMVPDLIVGHGVLGRLLARLACACGKLPTVWEKNPARRAAGSARYRVIDPDADDRRDYRAIYDASGDADIIDQLIQRLAKGGEITLAGFYASRLSFGFPPAFMREARLRVAAEWQPGDLAAVAAMIDAGALSLAGLVTHVRPATEACAAYPEAFEDPACLKMILDWRGCA
jgi:3-hydroxyethyl bacteriochlorophyllide a dehydrogenase